MGYVFHGEDSKLKRPVALKVMNQRVADTPHSRRRFLHEARAMAAVHHDNVATIFEVGECNGTPFMAMELLRGSTLEECNANGVVFGYEEILRFTREICKGLGAAHAKGIVHRDIKPANIWLEEDTNRVKILDFGLALASSPIDQLSARGAVVGTPGYLSPEQARSDPLDDRSDLYSLGVVLYELCTGKLPHEGKSVPKQLIAILAQRPVPIGELNPDIPAPLCDLIDQLLRKEPRLRPSSAKSLLEQLDQVETQCHVKSEVAQAINNLQAGLQEVVKKQSNNAIFDNEPITDPTDDPLAQPSTQSSPIVLHQRPASVASTPAVANARPLKHNPWQKYWPLATVGLIALLGLLSITFYLLGASLGRSSAPVVAAKELPAASSLPSPASAALSDPSPIDRGSIEPSPARASDQRLSQPSDQSNNRDSANPTTQVTRRPNWRGNESASTEQPASSTRPDSSSAVPGATESQFASAGGPSAIPATLPMTHRSDSRSYPRSSNRRGSATAAAKATPAPSTSTTSTSVPPTPAPRMKWETISTADGLGADAMVQKGSRDRFGSNPSIGVRTRGGVETNHSYLRFDLSSIDETRRWTAAAELVLTCVESERPMGATIRVYAVDPMSWREDRLDWQLSPSSGRLNSLPPIAQHTIDEPINESGGPRDGGANLIRIASAGLAQAIARADRGTLTLVLTGSNGDDSTLRLVSREHSASAAPKLLIQVPVVPPQSNRGGFRGPR